MNFHTTTISNRLSLRAPQRESLEILDHVCQVLKLEKDCDIAEALKALQAEGLKTLKDFERKFPSLCFALATGVGKTRLMGAFIAYLHMAHGVKNFFVVAPNLTIYNKLYADFTPNTPKYVFKGIGEFAGNPPIIITGDNYESGVGVGGGDLLESVRINIFNISKITAKDGGALAKDDERRSIARIRRLNETIGESYFDYLAGLDDLVVIMDESHRYRATAGMDALNDLKPVLGLELTATPQVEKGSKTVEFQNVVYDYPLACAMRDGFVKEPAVATRQNFDPKNYSEEELEKIKLNDGVIIHESRKADLAAYAEISKKPLVKPFMLVVAANTDHANELKAYMESPEFHGGGYAGKIIVVHSNVKGEEKDDVVEKLLTVERTDNPVEIVIHVNMLKEGWDVTNLYTIVPLRAANSRTLVEQSIGRGLRLPYGKRVGEPSIDSLTIVSHDKFQEIVDYANNPDSVIRKTVIIGEDIPEEGRKNITAPSFLDELFKGGEKKPAEAAPQKKDSRPSILETLPKFGSKEEREVAKAACEVVIGSFSKGNARADLSKPEVLEQISKAVEEKIASMGGQKELDFEGKKIDKAEVVAKAVEAVKALSIDIPKIIVTPKEESRIYFKDFELDVSGMNYSKVDNAILVKHLQTNDSFVIASDNAQEHERLEDIIVLALVNIFSDINYDDNAGVLYSLARQAVRHLRGLHKDDEDIRNILIVFKEDIAAKIHSQMRKHSESTVSEYEVEVLDGFRTVQPACVAVAANEEVRDFRETGFKKSRIGEMAFGGFEKSLNPILKFDSDTERAFSVIIDGSEQVLKWFKPGKNDIVIHYASGKSYLPDFIVECEDKMLLCETKKAKDVGSDEVEAKTKAAVEWCKNATEHALKSSGKPWVYMLIPDNAVLHSMSLDVLLEKYRK